MPRSLRSGDRNANADMDAFLEATPNLVAIFDADDRLSFANAAFGSAYGLEGECIPTWGEVIRSAYARGCGPVIDTRDIEDWLTRADTRRGTLPFRSFEVDFHDGRWFLVTETMQDGKLLLVGVDITMIKIGSRALRSQRDNAVRAAWTDPLTGLANRRYCLEQLEAWRQRSGVEAFGALAIMDLDGFKQVNDRYGHDVGDQILVHFGRLVLERVRLQDLFGRIGGEEFFLFMPQCGLEVARKLLDTILADLEAHSVIADLPTFRYSFSAGLIAMSPTIEVEQGLRGADKLLYRAKQGGRARVIDTLSSR